MIRCTRCWMPDTRPDSIFTAGICQACWNYEARQHVDWQERRKMLGDLCDRHRRSDGSYDCIVPVSGGKDSHFLVHTMKAEHGMHPFLFTVGNPLGWTEAGWHNFKNIGEAFNCDHFLFNMSTDMLRRAVHIEFEELLNPLKLVETACYTMTMRMAVQFNIPLVIFGENPEYEYGSTEESRTSANGYILERERSIFEFDFDFWETHGIPREELNAFALPSESDMERVRPEVIFMSYFVPWSSTNNLRVATHYGFRTLAHEWQREGSIDNFEQIDALGYMVHLWLKYPKFGFQRVSDVASRYVREGLLTLEEAKQLIRERDHILDRRALDDFLAFSGYTHAQFWDVVERFWNPELFERVGGAWRLRE